MSGRPHQLLPSGSHRLLNGIGIPMFLGIHPSPFVCGDGIKKSLDAQKIKKPFLWLPGKRQVTGIMIDMIILAGIIPLFI